MVKSYGILVYRLSSAKTPEFFLVHPGGPFFSKKDEGTWTIPKGGAEPGEDPLATATREFYEETGTVLSGHFISLEPIRQKGGKMVEAWATQADIDVSKIISNQFELEWPPRSGKKQMFPEVDRAGWFSIDEARMKINIAQVSLLEQVLSFCK
jgi:predicted NUDIX family NTP pyrophosphohydrolase